MTASAGTPRRGPPLSAAAAYRLWAATYATDGHNPLSACAADVVWRLLPPLPGKRVLDAGCGLGRLATAALGRRASAAIGVDRSWEMLVAGRRGDGPDGMRPPVAAADIRALPFSSQTFDVIVAVLVLSHVPEPAPAVVELGRVLAPGGALVMADMHPAAARRGWRRTFHDATGTSREVAWTPHQAETLEAACADAGLEVTSTRSQALPPGSLPPGATGGRAILGIRARQPFRPGSGPDRPDPRS